MPALSSAILEKVILPAQVPLLHNSEKCTCLTIVYRQLKFQYRYTKYLERKHLEIFKLSNNVIF